MHKPLLVLPETARYNMSDEWSNGYKAGYEEGYRTAMESKKPLSVATNIYDPGEIHESNEKALAQALLRALTEEK